MICCQLGAREHYAIPRATQMRGALGCLITDAWVPPGNPLGFFRRSLHERYHRDLADAPVRGWNADILSFELIARAKRLSGWPLIMARNDWFQRKAVALLRQKAETLKTDRLKDERPIVFAYSYAALDIFRFAKTRGWRTVLGQIDPGPDDEDIIAAEAARVPELRCEWQRAPQYYWEHWREECALADDIIVNSEWSKTCLMEAGVTGDKLAVIPLAYESPTTDTQINRSYPSCFTDERPLRVLFLGQINVRKGIAALFDAARALKDEPVEFWMVGPIQVDVPDDLRANSRIRWIGPVARSVAAEYYRKADVFLFPTLSDGFGLTQLEALANHLPIIASRNCGRVVQDGVNGLLLAQSIAGEIEAAIRLCRNGPVMLRRFAQGAKVDQRFSLSALAWNLESLLNR